MTTIVMVIEVVHVTHLTLSGLICLGSISLVVCAALKKPW